nr:MarR family transcriptional regulator [Cohnella sp. REN36]
MFFTANRLGRAITKIAEEEFAPTGLTPMYGYIIRLVNSEPGIAQKVLSDKLSIAPSTLTRFIDKLEAKRLVERKVHGKTVLVYPTPKGEELLTEIRSASKRLKERYEAVLSKAFSEQMNVDLNASSELLEKG